MPDLAVGGVSIDRGGPCVGECHRRARGRMALCAWGRAVSQRRCALGRACWPPAERERDSEEVGWPVGV